MCLSGGGAMNEASVRKWCMFNEGRTMCTTKIGVGDHHSLNTKLRKTGV